MRYNIGAVLADLYGADTAPSSPLYGWKPMRCPFHDDKHASAAVNGSEGRFHCFVCGIYEDAIGLVMERDHVGFQDAKRTVEEITGESANTVRGGDSLGGWFPERPRNHPRNSKTVGAWRSRLTNAIA